ncbi:metallophosphoesterase [Candidatus Babeliales bacterium]|nr:metallophosphoesterase [Candidatus Babeliales bacterium]
MKNNKSLVKALGFTAIVLMLLLGFFLLLPPKSYTLGFETIDEIVADASKKDEFTKPDDYNPKTFDIARYSTWNSYRAKTKKSFLQSRFENLLEFLGLKKRPVWSYNYFRNQLDKLTKDKQKNGFTSPYVARLVPKQNTRFIIFGDLMGAYHSLTRNLQKLISLNILTKDLKIISPNDCIVFTGDNIAQSPFVVETISIVAKLEERNPGKVWWLIGNDECDESWQQFIFKDKQRLAWTRKERPLTNVVRNYLETLPLGLLVSVPPHNSNDFVRFSHFGVMHSSSYGNAALGKYEDIVIPVNNAAYLKDMSKNRIENEPKIFTDIPSVNPHEQEKTINIQAIIKSVFKRLVFDKKSEGLQLLAPDDNATAWTIASCPTVIYSNFLDFHNDTFAIMQVAPKINDWTIALHYRDIRSQEDFKTKTYNLLSGAKV